MTTIGYYPGCSLGGTAFEYNRSLRAIAPMLGYDLCEVPDWVCCGASSAHAIDHHAALVLAADTLAKANKARMTQILAPCAMCYQRLATANHAFTEKPGLAARVSKALGEPADLPLAKVRPLSILNWLAEIPEAELKKSVVRPLTGLKVACYYGCLLVRPPKITGADNAETPRSMERIITALGAEPVNWSMALECCGGSFALSRKEVVLRQGERIYDSARNAGANVMCLACPMCHANLDMRQSEYTSGEPLPMLYLTQLIGWAFGLSMDALGLASHFVPTGPALAAIKR